MPQRYLTTLTPLRGIAAILVVMYHSNLMVVPFVPPGHTRFFDNGWLWVDFFFVLSGFIMCYAYGKYFNYGVNKSAYKKYIGARFARVYPLYFVTTIWAFVCALIIISRVTRMDPFFAEIINPKALPACLVLTQSMHIYFISPLNTPSWSLSTEWWVYMIFPFLVPYFIGLKRPGKLITTILIISFYVFLRFVVGPHTTFGPAPTLNIMTDFGFLRCLAGFITGMLFFTFYEHRSGYDLIKRDWFFVLCFFGVCAAMHFGLPDIIIIAFFPFILIAAAFNQTGIKRLLDTRALQRLGDWSFSIYMVHIPIVFIFTIFSVSKNPRMLENFIKETTDKPGHIFGLAMCALLVGLTLLMSAFMYRFVEIPARNYFNRAFKTKHKDLTAENLQV